eukprot:1362418-Amphidinium_carterae.1
MVLMVGFRSPVAKRAPYKTCQPPSTPCLHSLQHSASTNTLSHYTLDDVKNLLKKLKTGKAVPNFLSTAGHKEGRDSISPALTNYINSIITTSSLPPTLHGSTVVPVPKRNQNHLQMCNHRPIQLQSVTRKILGQLLLTTMKSRITTPTTQRCIGRCAGTDGALFVKEQLLAAAADAKESVALIYVDIKSAYDSVLHHIIFPPHHDHNHNNSRPPHDHFQHYMSAISTQHQLAPAAADYIQRHPTALLDGTIPENLTKLLSEWMHSWIATSHHWKEAQQQLCPPHTPNKWHLNDIINSQPTPAALPPPVLHMTRGMKQGDPLSTLLFVLFMDLPLQMIDSEYTQKHGDAALSSLPHVHTRLLQPPSSITSWTT